MKPTIQKYLSGRADLARPLVSSKLDGIDRIVVIPVLSERGTLPATLESVAANPPDLRARTLVICVVNNRAAPHAAPEAIRENADTLDWLDAQMAASPIRLAYIDASTPGNELLPKQGVGTARKLGMDHALRILSEYNGGRGTLICLDADTIVEPNYLGSFDGIAWGAVVNYAHRIDGPPEQQAAILCYEIFLRYYERALRYAGSAYAFHTIGSAMACSPAAYAAVSGMNHRTAGEDFYFLQKLAKTGPIARITSTTVHPSPRPSWRVPFGTGKRVQRFLDGQNDEYTLYNPESFRILRDWLSLVRGTSERANAVMDCAREISPSLADFLAAERFPETWTKLCQQSPSAPQLVGQFHRWFDALRTLRLIHHLRDHGHADVDMFEALAWLLPEISLSLGSGIVAASRQNRGKQRKLLGHLRSLAP